MITSESLIKEYLRHHIKDDILLDEISLELSKLIERPWNDGNIKPEKPGVYEQLCGLGKNIGYQYWTGEYWAPWWRRFDDALHYREERATDQNSIWRTCK